MILPQAIFIDSMSGGEILIILLALLLLFGSKNLPSIARNLGKSIESFRRASRDVTQEIMRADLLEDAPAKPKVVSSVEPVPAPPAPMTGESPVVKPSANSVERHESSTS